MTGVRVNATGSEVGIDIPMTAVTGEIGLGGIPPMMVSLAGEPSVIPAVTGSFAASLAVGAGQHGALPVQGLDAYNITVRPAVAAASLPRIGSSGVIVDLAALEHAQTGPTSPYTSEEVWLGPGAPANAVSRLRAAGLHIEGVERSSTLTHQAEHTGPALAYDFMLLATLVALLVAAVGTFSVLAAGGRGRAAEMSRAGSHRRAARNPHALAGDRGRDPCADRALRGGCRRGQRRRRAAVPASARRADRRASVLCAAGRAPPCRSGGAMLVVMLATALAARGILTSMSPTLLRNAADDVD